MTNVTPIQQPPIEDIRNALQIAQLWIEANPAQRAATFAPTALGDIARLLKHALEGLSEPSLAAVQAAATMLREAGGAYDNEGHVEPRYARDAAAVILHAQLTGEVPKTWSEP